MIGAAHHLLEPGEFHDRSPGRRRVSRMQKLLALTRSQPPAPPSVSTLEAFFSGVLWTEDVHPDGERTLRRAAM